MMPIYCYTYTIYENICIKIYGELIKGRGLFVKKKTSSLVLDSNYYALVLSPIYEIFLVLELSLFYFEHCLIKILELCFKLKWNKMFKIYE